MNHGEPREYTGGGYWAREARPSKPNAQRTGKTDTSCGDTHTTHTHTQHTHTHTHHSNNFPTQAVIPVLNCHGSPDILSTILTLLKAEHPSFLPTANLAAWLELEKPSHGTEVLSVMWGLATGCWSFSNKTQLGPSRTILNSKCCSAKNAGKLYSAHDLQALSRKCAGDAQSPAAPALTQCEQAHEYYSPGATQQIHHQHWRQGPYISL